MEEDTYEMLQKKLADSNERVERLIKELREYIRAEQVMVAAGLITDEKVKQAHEIVQTFSP
jgi:uncharacterized protein YaaN involved in tellurite resistance